MDGELSSQDAALLHEYLEANPEAAAWMENLDTARESDAVVADRFVTISSIQQEIAASSDAAQSTSRSGGNLISFSSFLRPLAAAAAIAVVSTLTWLGLQPNTVQAMEPSVVEFVDTDIPNASTTIFSDEESGWTVVWVEPETTPQS